MPQKNRFSGDELLRMWKQSGLSQRKLAKTLDMNFNSLHGRIHRAQTKQNNPRDSKDSIKKSAVGNTCTIDAKAKRITTLQELIDTCDIDTDIWCIDKHIVNKYETVMKMKTGEVHVEPIHQVKAWMSKLEPEALSPVISPVSVSVVAVARKKHKAAQGMNRSLVLSDPHFGFKRKMHTDRLIPFHSRKALSVALQMAQEMHFDKIVISGDLLDLAEWSDRFIRSPELYFTLQPALIETAWWLGQFRAACPHTDICVLEGNHDQRLTRSVIKHMNQAYKLKKANNLDGYPIMSIPHMIGAEDLDIEYVGDYPKGSVWLNDDIRVVHGHLARSKSGATVGAMLDNVQNSTVFGHIHRLEMASRTMFRRGDPDVVMAFSPGCLCRIDGTVPAKNPQMNWQQGLGIVHYSKDYHAFSPIPIRNGQAVYEGQHYVSEDVVDKLSEDTGWNY